MILFWVVLVAVIFILAKVLTNSFSKRGSRSETPMDVLKQRYAAGEISRDEFEEIKRDLVKK